MPLFLKQYGIDIIVFLAVIAFIELQRNKIHNLQNDNEVLLSQLSQYKYALAFQNEAIVKNKSDYDEDIKKLPTVLKTIDTKYKTQTQVIYEWKDSNETDCNASMQYINDFNF